MSVSRSSTPRIIDRRYAGFPEDLGVKLTRRFVLLLDPDKAPAANDVDPGIFCFVQQKAVPETNVPRQAFLAFLQHYSSLHQMLAQYAHLASDAILSAGEMLLGVDGKVLAWSFQTGYFYQQLQLDKVTPELLEKVGLSKEAFLSYNEWNTLSELCFQHFFSQTGRYNIIEKKANTSDELLEHLKEQRKAKEAALFEKLPGEKFKAIFSHIQEARDRVEQTLPLKMLRKVRTASGSNTTSQSASSSPAVSNSRRLNLSVDLSALASAVTPRPAAHLERIPASALGTPKKSPVSLRVPLEFQAEEKQVRSSPIIVKPVANSPSRTSPSVTTVVFHSGAASAQAANNTPVLVWPQPTSVGSSRVGFFGPNKVAPAPSFGAVELSVLQHAMQPADEVVGCCFSLKKLFSRAK